MTNAPCSTCGSVEDACDHRLVVSTETYDELVRLLEEPPKVLPELEKLIRKHREDLW